MNINDEDLPYASMPIVTYYDKYNAMGMTNKNVRRIPDGTLGCYLRRRLAESANIARVHSRQRCIHPLRHSTEGSIVCSWILLLSTVVLLVSFLPNDHDVVSMTSRPGHSLCFTTPRSSPWEVGERAAFLSLQQRSSGRGAGVTSSRRPNRVLRLRARWSTRRCCFCCLIRDIWLRKETGMKTGNTSSVG